MNLPGYTDRYHNLEIGIDKRMSNRWQVQASYLATKKRHVGRRRRRHAGPAEPEREFLPEEPDLGQRRSASSGSYQAPYGILASAMYEYQSGAAQARDVLFRTGLKQLSSVTLRMEPFGASAAAGGQAAEPPRQQAVSNPGGKPHVAGFRSLQRAERERRHHA